MSAKNTQSVQSVQQPTQAEIAQALAAQLLANVGVADTSGKPLTDRLSDILSTPVNAAGKLGAATTVAFSNAAAAYALEKQVQTLRAQKQLKDMADQAAARILALQ